MKDWLELESSQYLRFTTNKTFFLNKQKKNDLNVTLLQGFKQVGYLVGFISSIVVGILLTYCLHTLVSEAICSVAIRII